MLQLLHYEYIMSCSNAKISKCDFAISHQPAFKQQNFDGNHWKWFISEMANSGMTGEEDQENWGEFQNVCKI